jgi:type IV secretion system protein TrbL
MASAICASIPTTPSPEWSAGVFTQVMCTLELTLERGLTSGFISEAMAVFQILAAMEVALLCVWWLINDDTDQLLANYFVTGVTIGVFAQLITNLMPLGRQFADGAVWFGLKLGLDRITVEQFHDPGAIMLAGWRLFTPVFQYIENLGLLETPFHLGTIIVYAVIGSLGWICVFWIGWHVLIAWWELLLVAAYGTCLLIFAIFRHTRFIGIGVLFVIAACGIRLGMLATLVSIIFPIMGAFTQTDATDPGIDTVFASMGVMFGFAWLCWNIDKLSARLTGGHGLPGSGVGLMVRTTAAVATQGGSEVVRAGRQVGARVARGA